VALAAGAGTIDVAVPKLAPDAAADKPKEVEPERDRTLAYIVGGTGLGVVALGFAFGGVAMAEQGSADESCDGRFCNQEGLDGHDRANAWAWASNITIGVGAAAVATGVVLFFVGPELSPSEPSTPTASPSLGPGPGQLGAGATWTF